MGMNAANVRFFMAHGHLPNTTVKNDTTVKDDTTENNLTERDQVLFQYLNELNAYNRHVIIENIEDNSKKFSS